jgi:hypothetical protein
MKGPRVSHHDVSKQAYEKLIKHMSKAEGVTVKQSDQSTASITGEETEINFAYDSDASVLKVNFEQVPDGLETYYWGHGLHRVHLFNTNESS